MLTTMASAAARVCSPSPVMNGSRKARTKTEARALEHEAEGRAEDEEQPARPVAHLRVHEGHGEQQRDHQHADQRLRRARRLRVEEDRAASRRPPRVPAQLPHEVAQADDGADEEPDHHAEAGQRQRAHGAEEAADVAAERQHRPDAQHGADRALHQLAAHGDADRELAAQQRGGSAPAITPRSSSDPE